MRIPFDGLVCRAAAWELGQHIGARIQKVIAIGDQSVAFQLFDRKPTWLTVNWDPEFFRLHVAPRTPQRTEVTPFVTTLRRHLDGAALLRVDQKGLDRVVRTVWGTELGEFHLVAELVGRQCCLVLTDQRHHLLGASQWMGSHQSKRPLLPGQPYEALPPSPPVDVESGEGLSPFLKKLLAAGLSASRLKEAIQGFQFELVLVPGVGVYPLSVRGLGFDETPIQHFGEVLDLVMHQREENASADRLRRLLHTQFQRAILAREVAINDLHAVLDTASRAAQLQRNGELILAYMGSCRGGDATLEAWDYDGEAISIPLRADLSPKENALRYFEKAKRAKQAAAGVQAQAERIERELEQLHAWEREVPHLELESLERLRTEATTGGFFRVPRLGSSDPQERPFAGHRVKVVHGPRGYTILVGENAEANDFLTLRVAKPSDIWLHVRGSPGAHVIIQVPGKGVEVPSDVLHEAAMVAARNSPQKHSSYVPVDWTHKRYVRRIKGGGPGVVQYEREKTLHVDPALKG